MRHLIARRLGRCPPSPTSSPTTGRSGASTSRAGRHLVAELDRRLQADAGISHPEYTVLLSLNEAPERRLRTGELAELLAWEKSRVSHQVARMESRGLVERTPCETDGRGTWIVLTAEGRRLLLRAMRDHAAAIRELFVDVLTDDEKASMRAASIRMLEGLDPAAITAALGREDAAVGALGSPHAGHRSSRRRHRRRGPQRPDRRRVSRSGRACASRCSSGSTGSAAPRSPRRSSRASRRGSRATPIW